MKTRKPNPTNAALERAIDKCGGLSSMARALGIRRYQVVQSWQTQGRVPAPYCDKVEVLTQEPSELLNPTVNWPHYRNNPAPTVVSPVTGDFSDANESGVQAEQA